MQRPRILFLPRIPLAAEILSHRAKATLESLGQVVWNEMERDFTADELADLLPGADAVVTSWGSPAFSVELLARAERLRVVGHAAGSVKHLMPKAGFDRGIVVLSAAAIIADSVAEYTLWAMLSAQRDLYRHDRFMKTERGWREPDSSYSHELFGKAVGIVSASMVGRRVVDLLKPFRCDVMVYDPYLSVADAEKLGVRKVSLDDLFADSDIVSVHAPVTAETKEMIRARHLQSLRTGALFINTARAWVVDQSAMLAELTSGRFRAVLDVFDAEPLPPDDRLRDLENVLLTPHVSGFTTESRLRLVEAIADDMARFFAGEPTILDVPWEHLSIMA
jgi:phosphoglycerate dehydrogenase-like enzyme